MEPSYYQKGILIKMEPSYYQKEHLSKWNTHQNGTLIFKNGTHILSKCNTHQNGTLILSKWNTHQNGTLILKGSLGSIDEGVLDRASASSCVTVILWVLQPQIQRRPRSCFCFLL